MLNLTLRLGKKPSSALMGLLLCFANTQARAQVPDLFAHPAEPSELTALRKLFITRGLAAARTLSDQYTSALNSLERELAASADYEAALSAQQRRLEIAAAYKAALGENGISNAINLKLADAKLNGVTFDRQSNLLTGWRKLGNAATWDVLKLVPGSYQVSVSYTSSGETAGDFEFFEDSTLSGSDLNHRTEIVQATEGPSVFKTVQLAPINLLRTSSRFTLRVSRVRGIAPLMSVKEVKLMPVTADAAAVVDANTETLDTLKQNHSAKIKALAQPLSDSYFATLDLLEADYKKQEDTSSLAALTAERGRVIRWLADPVSNSPVARSSNLAESLTADGYIVLAENARYVPDATNAGDFFHVISGGQNIAVRLLWVTCPPPEPDDKEQLALHAKYFGITPDDAETIGKLARDFTAGVLADKPLKLLTRGQLDKDGRTLAVVLPEGIEDLASALVENGLASVAVPEKKGPPRRTAFTPLTILKERESAVKARPIAPGAWGLAVK